MLFGGVKFWDDDISYRGRKSPAFFVIESSSC